ncbi:hypothetical protein Hanom_Chr14g01300511 [Helianthus anomalus]
MVFFSFVHTILLISLKKTSQADHKLLVSMSDFVHPIITIHLNSIIEEKGIPNGTIQN